MMNEIELTRLIDNNLSNAIKYGKPISEIEIRLFEDSGVCVMEFSNEGTITNKEEIFQKFHRESHMAEGFGVGLYMVKTICEAYAITITLNTEERIIFTYHFPKQLIISDA